MTAAGKRGRGKGEGLCLGALGGGEDGTLEPLWQQAGQFRPLSFYLMVFAAPTSAPSNLCEDSKDQTFQPTFPEHTPQRQRGAAVGATLAQQVRPRGPLLWH